LDAAFVDHSATITDKRLDLLSIFLSQGPEPAQITFQNSFNLQEGFDGGVLEISIDRGVTFQDILTVGTFVTGVTMARSGGVVAILWLGGRHGLAPRPALLPRGSTCR
jgi:hypothetical protein